MIKSTDPSILNKFPKIRPTLPKDIKEIYTVQYKSNRDGQTPASSLAQTMESWLHKQVAKDVSNSQTSRKTTLEIGAGTLNQLQYEPVMGPYDIVEPFTGLFEDSPRLERIREVYSDISEVPDGRRYDRITSIATLEHICNLPEVVARCGLLLGEKGVFRASVPNEGTFLWTMGWKLTTGLEFRIKYGLDYGVLMKHEHVNTAREIGAVLAYFFENVESRVFGLTKSLSLYHFYECKNPRLTQCHEVAEL